MSVYEEQLDLFAEQPERTVSAGRSSAPRTGYAACPKCVGCVGPLDMHILQSRTPPALPGTKATCARCFGAGCIEVPVRLAEGFWWYEAGLQVIEAANEAKARRKAGDPKAILVPLKIEQGGYGVS